MAIPKTGPADGPMAIKAPVEGRVLKILHESEGVINSGDPLVEIGDRSANLRGGVQ